MSPREDSQKPATPTDVLYSETQLMHLASKVEELRMEVFGSPAPPFATEQGAADWIEDVGFSDFAKEEERLRDTYEERQKALEEILRLANEHLIELDHTSTPLPYRRPDRPVVSMPTTPGTRLHKLARGTQLMARYTKFFQADLVAHVLTGLTQEILRTSLTTTDSYYAAVAGGGMTQNNSANIEVNTLSLDREEFRSVYNSIRDHITGKGKKGEIEEAHIRIWELVREKGGPPQEHGVKGRFWEEIREAINSELPTPRNGEKLRFTTAKGVERAYDNVVKHLS